MNTDLLLYLAARSENMDLLKKFYKKKVIIIDRFTDSKIAYQHYGLVIDINFINFINSRMVDYFKIDFTFLNIVNKSNMIKRLKTRKNLNRYDVFNSKFYQKVQAGFLKLAKKKSSKYQIIDSNLDINLNEKLILKKINKLVC